MISPLLLHQWGVFDDTKVIVWADVLLKLAGRTGDGCAGS